MFTFFLKIGSGASEPGSQRRILNCTALLAVVCLLGTAQLHAQEELKINVHYVEQKIDRKAVLSKLVTWPEDDGLAGAQLGLSDNNTTGKFLKHKYELTATVLDTGAETIEHARSILADGAQLAIINADDETLAAIAALPEAQDDILFNARNPSIALREQQCSANLFHTIASRNMLSDALMQFLSKRQWRSLFLIEGNRTNDKLFATALKLSARKFGLKFRHEKQWLEDADIRRNAAQEVPVFTQAKKYDAIVVADEDRDFAQYILYNTWLPRPVAGSAGLTPRTWSGVMEQWGALQLQTRFNKHSNRKMTSVDYANWAAVRSIGEAVTRTNSIDVAGIRAYLLSDKFSLAAFKGKKASFRTWNGQLRQPVPLVHDSGVVAVAPMEGFLHQLTELDTLGIDEPQSKCSAFNQ